MSWEVYQAQFLTVHASILEHIVRTQIRSPRQGNKADKPCTEHPDGTDVLQTATPVPPNIFLFFY